MLSIQEVNELKEILATPKRIVITTHTNPDGDAIGSSLAMLQYLRKRGHDVVSVVPNHFPGFLKWLPGSNEIVIYERKAKKVQQALINAELVFCLDYNALQRVGSLFDVLERDNTDRVLIDHHIDPEIDSFKYVMSTTATSSTGELIFDFIELMNDTDLIDKAIADSIYTGIVTDTGSFSFAANFEKTYHITAELIKKGVDTEQIHKLIYDTFSEDRLRLLGHAISNRLVVWDEFHTALIYLTKEDLKKHNYKVGDIEGVVNYPLMMEKINMAVLLTERDRQIRLSFRSKGEFSVNDLARKYFNGGGHRNAAGGRMFIGMQETISKIKAVLPEYKEQLDFQIKYSNEN